MIIGTAKNRGPQKIGGRLCPSIDPFRYVRVSSGSCPVRLMLVKIANIRHDPVDIIFGTPPVNDWFSSHLFRLRDALSQFIKILSIHRLAGKLGPHAVHYQLAKPNAILLLSQ
jgi:hypothetical protein